MTRVRRGLANGRLEGAWVAVGSVGCGGGIVEVGGVGDGRGVGLFTGSVSWGTALRCA